jgi:hypothetical protein
MALILILCAAKKRKKEKKMRGYATRIDMQIEASFSSLNWEEKHCIRISVAFRLYLVKIIQILTN